MICISTFTLMSLINSFLLMISFVACITPPHHMSEEEKLYCLQLSLQGNEGAKNLLMEHYFPTLTQICKQFNHQGLDEESIFLFGTIGLLKGFNSFQPENNNCLSDYLYDCIVKEISLHLQENIAN